MALQFIIFFSLFIIIFFGGHYFVYYSLKFFYSLSGRIKHIFFISSLFLPVFFIAVSAFTSLSNSAIIHILYLILSVWLGFLFYTVQLFVFAWILYFILKRKKYKIVKFYFASIVLSLAAIISSYGLINAQILKVKEMSLQIENLPNEWKGKKVLQLSDVHLGSIYRPKYFDKIIAKAKEIEPDYIMITGDYLDGSCAEAYELVAPLMALSDIAHVYFINGNHEIYDGMEDLREVLKDVGVIMLENEIVLEKAIQIVGLDYSRDRQNLENLETISRIDSTVPSILLSHEPIYTKEAKDRKVDLHLSGHTHKGQLFPASFITYLIYGKYYYGLNKEETYHQYTTSGIGTWGPPMRVLSDSELPVFLLK